MTANALREVEVFGRRFLAEKTDAGWKTYLPSNDGKFRGAPAGAIPHFVVTDDELLAYLADLYHEDARPDRQMVRWIR